MNRFGINQIRSEYERLKFENDNDVLKATDEIKMETLRWCLTHISFGE